jgi:hypothetical protein
MTDTLRHLVLTYPAIDNHAHPLLVDDSTLDFTGAISEARGDALPAAYTSLAAMRAAHQLGPLYGLEQVDPTWESLLEARRSLPNEKSEIRDACFQAARLQCLLLDDGLPGKCESIPSHDQYTISPSKRIVRIEVVAEVRRSCPWTHDPSSNVDVTIAGPPPSAIRCRSRWRFRRALFCPSHSPNVYCQAWAGSCDACSLARGGGVQVRGLLPNRPCCCA